MSQNIWRIIWSIPRLLKTSWALALDPRVPKLRKIILVALALAYFLWPFDLLPDYIPLIGQLDELGLFFLLLNWFVNRSNAESTRGDSHDLTTEYRIEDDCDDT